MRLPSLNVRFHESQHVLGVITTYPSPRVRIGGAKTPQTDYVRSTKMLQQRPSTIRRSSPAVAATVAAITAVSLLALLAGCASPYNAEGMSGLTQPRTLTSRAAAPMVDTPVPESAVAEPDEQGVDETGAPVTYKITTTKYKASATYDTNVLLNPSTDVIYPGSVLLGESIDDGSYIEITGGEKRPVTISFDLSGVDGDVTGKIVPTLSNYRELKNKILGQSMPRQTSTYSFEKIEINSESELGVKVSAGASFDGGVYAASVKNSFSFDNSKKTNKVMVKFMQTFYTVDVDQGTFIYKSYDLADFGGYRPVYVSSIAYGRLAYITIESTESIEAINNNLEAAFKYGNAEAEASAEVAKSWLSSKAQTNITVIGGSTVAVDLESFMAMLQEDVFSSDNPGTIIAYKLRFVDDNTVANTIFNGDYTIRKAEAVKGKGINLTLRITGLNAQADDTNGNLELYGRIHFKSGSQSEDLLNVANTDYMQLPKIYTNYPDLSTCDWWKGSAKTLNLASTTTDFTIETSAFGEVDDGANEKFIDTVNPLTVSALTNGKAFKIKCDMVGYVGKQYLEFTIVPTIEYLY